MNLPAGVTAAKNAVIVGGGFFGAYLALLLAERGRRTVIVEREPDLMLRASCNNQARVHNGYHYPRSLMTAVRSRVNFPRFIGDFPESVVRGFEKYYAISSVLGNVTAAEYETFMARVGAPLKPAPERVVKLFDKRLIEQVWAVEEVAFDATRLRETMRHRLREAGVEVVYATEARKVEGAADGSLLLSCHSPRGLLRYETPLVLNCTYSGLNRLRHASGLPLVPLKHEMAEIALVEPPPETGSISVTVMCGPFFSLMPFPQNNLWSLSHVRHTPHCHWTDSLSQPWRDPYLQFDRAEKHSDGLMMIRDAARYMPALNGCSQRGSIWEIKTVLPQSELDDGRPILFHRDEQLPGFVSVMGGKMDNIYDVAAELETLGAEHTGADRVGTGSAPPTTANGS
jgi:glycine/D-amino acid oxidase-like deaminating enzyme